MLYCEKVYYCRKVCLLLRKSILLPKSMPIIAKRFINAEKYIFIAKRFNYAELYRLPGHYTITSKGLEHLKFAILSNQWECYFPFCTTPVHSQVVPLLSSDSSTLLHKNSKSSKTILTAKIKLQMSAIS